MAKMIDAFLNSLRLDAVARRREQRTFLSEYLPILEKSIEVKAASAIARRQRDDLARLHDAAIAAGIAEPTIEAERSAALERIRVRFDLKRRANAQNRKRALAKRTASELFDDVLAELVAAEAAAVADIERRFAPSATDLPAATQAYRSLLAAVTADTAAVVGAIVRRRDRRFAVVRSTYAAKLARLDARIAELVSELETSPRDRRETVLRSRIAALTRALDKKSAAGASAAVRSKYAERIARIDAGIAKRTARLNPVGDDGNGNVLPDGVILSVRNLTMRFGGLRAVDDLSFDVKEGEIFGLIGPNGAGKTTIFNCITRFYRATSGEMYYRKNLGQVIRLNDYPVHDIIRQGIVRTFQNVELVWELSILDNLLVAAHTVYRTGFFGQLLHTPRLKREEEVLRAKALSVLKTLDLLPYAYAVPYGLPYGILKKIELARTLMASPRLIILDEPAAGLNDRETEDLAKLIKRIRDDHHATIFLVEHDMGLVMDVCDTVCAISFGKMLAIGTPAEIQADKAVKSAYLGEES
ncbi:MAG: ABC transporter ATP-binding protein [Candidatus Izemoplasmatales bacterium]